MKLLAPAQAGTVEGAQTGQRTVRADGADHDARVYDRLALPIGAVVAGPALLEQADTTIFIDPGLQGRVDEFGNLIIEPMEAS